MLEVPPMSEKKPFKLPAPAIAIGLIVVCAVAAEYWLIPREIPPVATPTKPEVESIPEIAPPAPSQDVPAVTTWPVYHGGTDLSGNSGVTLSDKPVKLWQYFADGPVMQAPVGDDRGIYVATTSGNVVALDFLGKERWTKRLTRGASDGGAPTPDRIDAPAACFRSTVFVGSNSGIVHALNAENGDVRWTYDIGGDILGTVNMYDPEKEGEPVRLLCIERGEGALHCINFDTGKQLWRTDPIKRTDGSAAVANGIVAYGSCASAFHVFGALDGRRMHTVELGGDCQVASGPALVGDVLYCGSRLGHFFCVNVQTGQIVWTNKDSQKELFTTPAIGADLVVFGSDDKNIYAVDRKTGVTKWKHETRGTPTSPIIASDKIITGSEGVLLLLKLDTGKEIWNYEVSDSISSPSIINQMIVVGSEDGTVMAFGEGTT
jgi:outer membrane protein assembly factor BamB